MWQGERWDQEKWMMIGVTEGQRRRHEKGCEETEKPEYIKGEIEAKKEEEEQVRGKKRDESQSEGRKKETYKRNMSFIGGTAGTWPSQKPQLLPLSGSGENKHLNQKYHYTCRALYNALY